MKQHTVIFQPDGRQVKICSGMTLLQAQIAAGLRPDAPCGGKGTCGKCRVTLEGKEVLACQTIVDRDMVVFTSQTEKVKILTSGHAAQTKPDGTDDYALAFDIGTTTVVAYLMDGHTGNLLAQGSCMNPQSQFGADVISRIQYVLKERNDALHGCIRSAMEQLAAEVAAKAGIAPEEITTASIVGNTAMHHLLLNIAPKSLVTPPYMPAVSEAL